MTAHKTKTLVCQTSDIADPGSKAFELKIKRKTQNIFIVHKDGCFYGYLNKCPHTGATLEWQEDQFLDMDNALIQCAVHDALFLIDTGECIAGPCNGDQLKALPLDINDGNIFLAT